MKPPFLEHQIGSRRNDVDDVGSRHLVIDDLAHRQARLAPEDVGHHAAVRRRHVLGNHINAIELARQAGHKLAQGLQPTGRCTDADHMVAALGRIGQHLAGRRFVNFFCH